MAHGKFLLSDNASLYRKQIIQAKLGKYGENKIKLEDTVGSQKQVRWLVLKIIFSQSGNILKPSANPHPVKGFFQKDWLTGR